MQLGPFDQVAKALAQRPHLEVIARGGFPPPVSVKIELTSVCNHDCHFCAYRRIVSDPQVKDRLDGDRVLELVDELAAAGVQGVMFTGGGEPLLHPRADEILSRCRALGLAHALITNGSRLSRLADETLRGLRWVRFSINAGDAEGYARVHGVGVEAWDAVWEQVRRAADRSRFPALTVGVSFVVTSWNAGGIERSAELARDSGAAYVHFRPAFQGPDTELDRQLDPVEIEAIVARLQALPAPGGRFSVYGITRRFHEIVGATSPSPAAREHIHCRSTPLVAYVLPDGKVSICTMVRSASFNPRVPDPFLGSLKEARFMDLWGTEHHRAIIRGLSTSGCTRCHFAEYNRALAMVERDELHVRFL